MAAGNWVTLGVSIIADTNELFYWLYCDQTLIKSGNPGKKLDMTLSSFRIGNGFNGKIREFKMYYVSLGD